MSQIPIGQLLHWKVSRIAIVAGKDQTEALKNANARRYQKERIVDPMAMAVQAYAAASVAESTDAELVTKADTCTEPHAACPLTYTAHALGKGEAVGVHAHALGKGEAVGVHAHAIAVAEKPEKFDVKAKEKIGDFDGLPVFIVEGSEVRAHLVDFAGGGNPCAYARMPNEIWVERSADAFDQAMILVHELVEYLRMKYGKEAYQKAHASANAAETLVRQTAGQKEAVAESALDAMASAIHGINPAVREGRESAWWVHPGKGEVVPVHAHAAAVAEKPERFGLSHSEVARAGGGKGFNYLDNSKKGARNTLIDAATKKGWIRVRSITGGSVGSIFQTHGNAHNVPATIDHLEKRGHKFRGAVQVEDTASETSKEFPNTAAVRSAYARGEFGGGKGDSGASARSTLRARLLGGLGHLTGDDTPTYSAYERKNEDTVRQHGDDPVRGAPTMSATTTPPVNGDDQASIDLDMSKRIARRMALNKAGKDNVTPLATTPPLSNDNDLPAVRRNDDLGTNQMPPDLR